MWPFKKSINFKPLLCLLARLITFSPPSYQDTIQAVSHYKAMHFSLLSVYVSVAMLVRCSHSKAPQVEQNGLGHAGADGGATLQARACYDGPKQSGCDKGYCWRRCEGDGHWCWTALNQGYGDWIQCASDADCGNKGQSCSVGGDAASGCGC